MGLYVFTPDTLSSILTLLGCVRIVLEVFLPTLHYELLYYLPVVKRFQWFPGPVPFISRLYILLVCHETYFDVAI